MKALKLIALVILLLAGTAWADDMDRYPPPGPDGRILQRWDDYRSGATEAGTPSGPGGSIPWVDTYKDCMNNCGDNLLCMGECVDKLPKSLPPTKTGESLMFQSEQDYRAHQIREWAASGEVCRVLGHMWGTLPLSNIEYGRTGVTVYCGERRRCSICGKTETKKEVWE